MLGPFVTASRRTPHHHSPGVTSVASHAACASMSTTTTTKTRDRGDRYGPMEWAQKTAKVHDGGGVCVSVCVRFRYTFQPNGFVLHSLTMLNVILGVVAAFVMPNHAAFMHRYPYVWIFVYTLDFIHGIFM